MCCLNELILLCCEGLKTDYIHGTCSISHSLYSYIIFLNFLCITCSPPPQTYLLEKALQVHAARVEPSLQAFHSKLESCFEDFQCMVFPEKRQQRAAAQQQRRPMRSATIARPLPPTPFASQGGSGGSPPSG